MIRRFLNLIYKASGVVAAGFLAAICITVVLQVAANIINKIMGLFFGASPGLIVPSYAEFTGFFLVAASFFALAYTLQSGVHIRVSLLINRLGPFSRRWVEVWCLALGAMLTGYFSFYAFNLVYESYVFGDLAVGMVPLPLWIPQFLMALGSAVLFTELVDDLVQVLSGRAPSYQQHENRNPSKKSE